MKKVLAIAVLLLASTSAYAQYTFEYGGRTIRIDPDRGTVSIPGVYDNTGRRPKSSRNDDGDRPRKQPPQETKADPQPRPADTATAAPTAAPVEKAPAPAALPPADTSTTAAAPADTATMLPSAAPPPQVQPDNAPVPRPAPLPTVAAPPPPAQKQAAAPATAVAPAANSPLGVWLTEEREGKVRIEQCGANLCGYSVDKKSNQNGEQVLINMRPGKDSKWSGRILDPNTGGTYDSTIALKGNDSLRVQGCAFGGVFCGGQTWSRVN